MQIELLSKIISRIQGLLTIPLSSTYYDNALSFSWPIFALMKYVAWNTEFW